jgi:MoaA/NifB/PqqE/SkfB family radical SAM enzyme
VKLLLSNNEIETIHVELTTHCNAACPFCARNDYGYRTRTDFPLVSLTIDQWKRMFDEALVPNLKRIYFSGTYGEPFMCKDIETITDYCSDKFPNVTLEFSTNGNVRNSVFWSRFGTKKNVRVRFALDGVSQEIHSLHRIGTSFDEIISNAKAFISSGGNAVWLMILFRHNQHQVNAAKLIANRLGFTDFILKENGKDLGWVYTNDTDGYWILPVQSKTNIDKPPHRGKYKPFVRNSYEDFIKQETKWVSADRKVSCSSLNNKSIYIAADGRVYPCCWLGQYPETYKFNNFKDVLGDIDNRADVVGLEKAIDWFPAVQKSWGCKSMKDGMLMNCVGCAEGHFFQET